MNELKLKPMTVSDCIECPALPDVQEVRRDLYNCARGRCQNCSRIRSPKKKQIEVGGCLHDLLDDANEILNKYKEDRKAIFPPSAEKGAVLDFLGRHPLVKIDGEIYLVRRYLPQENHWLLEKQKWNSALGSWYNCDDFDYIFDRFGHLVRKEG